MSYVIESGERRVPVEQVQHNGDRAARGFASLGVREGDSVAMLLRNDVCIFEAMAGASVLGAYAVPVNWHWKGEESGYVIRDCGARVLVVHADLLAQVQDELPDAMTVLVAKTPPEIADAYGIARERCAPAAGALNWDDWLRRFAPWDAPPAASRGNMIYTSGTTGRPKGVRREPASPELQQQNTQRAAEAFGVRPGANVAMTGPIYHSAPSGYGRLAFQLGCNILLLPRFDAEGLLQAIEQHRLSHMHVVPTMFTRLLKLPQEVRTRYDVSSLEFVIHGAAPCPPEIKRRMIEWWGPVIHEYYGSTEAGIVTVVDSEQWLARPGTVGRPMPGTRVAVYDEQGEALPAGQSGEIYMTLNTLTDFTYHNADEKRREIGRGNMVTNGDVGYIDEEGYVYLNDRKRDMVISGGVNIYPAEIEAVLHEMPGVHDCAVFGIPDEEFGEALAAAVQQDDGVALEEAEVRAWLRERLAGYKVPRIVAFHADLPREDSGKIFKRKLREPYWQEAGRSI